MKTLDLRRSFRALVLYGALFFALFGLAGCDESSRGGSDDDGGTPMSSAVLAGSGAPILEQGKVGDYYLDTAAGPL